MKHLPIWGGTCSVGNCSVPVEYDTSNNYVMVQFDGIGGIRKYSVAGKWKVLKEGSWYAGWSVNGVPAPLALEKKVTCVGKKQRIEYETYESVRIVNELFCHPGENIVYTVYRIHNERTEPIEWNLHVGFEVDTVSYHMEKLRLTGKTEAAAARFIPQGSRYFDFEAADDFRLSFASNYVISSIVNEGCRFNLHYSLAIQPGEAKDLVYILSAVNSYGKDALETFLTDWPTHSTAIDRENEWLRETFRSDDAELNSLYGYCLNASLSSFKNLGGSFRGFFAGIDYQSPPRTYYRDGYWTMLPSLPYRPAWVRDQIITLAHGIGANGDCPSAVIYNQDTEQYEPFWPDHFDSPSFFVMMVYDYLSWTRDFGLLEAKVKGRTVKELMERVLAYLIQHASADNYPLVKKPNNRRDWVDNVFREGYVLYDLALYCRALYSAESICRAIGESDRSLYYGTLYTEAKNRLQQLIREEGYFNYKNSDGFIETNLSIELAQLVVFDLLPPEEQSALIDLLSEQLETKNNPRQMYGDWGVMTVFPFYRNVHHTVEKSIFPYRYHNGSDWPYWDGVFAWAKLMRGNKGWRYPLTRWFQVSLEHGWLTPVEYYGPVYGKGSNLQGWSSMPAAAMIMGGIGLRPSLDQDRVKLQAPPWGNFTMKHIHFRGNVYHISYQDECWKIESDRAGDEHPFIT
jgi:glycogen debranching enzyme